MQQPRRTLTELLRSTSTQTAAMVLSADVKATTDSRTSPAWQKDSHKQTEESRPSDQTRTINALLGAMTAACMYCCLWARLPHNHLPARAQRCHGGRGAEVRMGPMNKSEALRLSRAESQRCGPRAHARKSVTGDLVTTKNVTFHQRHASQACSI